MDEDVKNKNTTDIDIPVKGDITIRKKSRIKAFYDSVIKQNATKAKDHVIRDVIVPSIIGIFSKSIKEGSDVLLYGSTRRDNGYDGPRISYSSYFGNYGPDQEYRYGTQPQKKPEQEDTIDPDLASYDDIEFMYREDAELILKHLRDIIPAYGFTKVSDLNDILNKTFNIKLPIDFTMNRYGWFNLNTARVKRCPNGKYKLMLPKAVPIG